MKTSLQNKPHTFEDKLRKLVVLCTVAGVFLLVLALRGNSIMTPFERDEGEYAYSARLLLRGDVPYTESFIQKPPLIIYTYAIGQLVDPYGVWSPRVLAILFVLGTIYLVGYIASKEFGWQAGIAAMWVAAPMLSFPYLAALAANTELFMLLPLTATVALLVKAKSLTKVSHKLNTCAGFLATTAILYKPIAVFPLILLFLIWTIRIWMVDRNIKNTFLSLCFWAFGTVASLCIFLGYIFFRGAGSAFWEMVVEFNRYYAGFFGLGFDYLFHRISQFFVKWTPLFVLLPAAFIADRKKILVYFGLLLVSVLGVFQTPIGHYYLLLMPFWAIITGSAIVSVAKLIDTKAQLFLTCIMTCIVVGYMLLAVSEQFGKTPDEIGGWVYGRNNPFLESVMVGKKLKEITRPEDYVFVAGSEPQILYYADRKSSSRFVITYPFVIKTPMQLAYQQEAIREIKEREPVAIVLSQREESGLWDEKSPQAFRDFLTAFIQTKYELRGAAVWSTEKFSWVETPNDNDISQASLLLFSKKNE